MSDGHSTAHYTHGCYIIHEQKGKEANTEIGHLISCRDVCMIIITLTESTKLLHLVLKERRRLHGLQDGCEKIFLGL